MKTFLPPKHGAAKKQNPGNSDNNVYLELCQRAYPAARRTAVRSVIPGLGQLKNGELGKGLLFLSVTAVNFGALGLFLFNAQFAKAVTDRFHTTFGGPALLIYAGLMITFVSYAIRDAYDRAVQIIRDGKRFPRYRLTLAEAASGSYLFHFAMMAALVLMVLFFIAPQQPSKQVTEIELVHEEPKPAEKPKPPAPKRQPKREQPKPVVEHKQVVKPVVQPKPVVVKKVEPPKPLPVAVTVPTKEPTPIAAAPVQAPAPAPAAPPAPASSAIGGTGTGGGIGGPGGGGNGTGDKEVDMGPYMRELQRKIKHAWYPPKGNESKRIKVSFKVHKDGTISHLKLVTSSGVDIADDAATQAVQNAAPFAHLPDGVGDDVDINFTFDYNVFGRGRG